MFALGARWVVVIAMFASMWVGVEVRPAGAGNTGGAKCGSETCDAKAIREPEAGASGKAPKLRCEYKPLVVLPGHKVYDVDGSEVVTDGTGAWYEKTCWGEDGSVIYFGGMYLRPADLREEALAQLRLPAPAIRLNPAADRPQLVNLATWLYLDPSQWQGLDATASVPGLSVTVRASPQRVVWNMGNGDEVVCQGPGTPYDSTRPAEAQSTDCSYTYRRSSAEEPNGAYRVTATVEWGASWTSAIGGGSLGTMRRSATVPVRVAESQAVNQRGES